MPREVVGEIMHRGAITCSPSTSLDEAVRILGDSDITALVVVGNAGELLGILSHTDVLRHYGETLAERKVGEIMSPGAVMVEPDTPIEAAVAIMLNSHFHRLVVTTPSPNGPIPVGILSSTDIIRHLRGARWAWRWE